MPFFLDTNCLLRYLLWDNQEQAEIVAGYIEDGACTSPEFLSECVYVLTGRFYRRSRKAVARACRTLLEDVDCEHSEAMLCALDLFGRHNLDFPDCILAARKLVEGVDVVTFDKKLAALIKRLEGR